MWSMKETDGRQAEKACSLLLPASPTEARPPQTPRHQPALGLGQQPRILPPGFLPKKHGTRDGGPRVGRTPDMTRPGRAEGPGEEAARLDPRRPGRPSRATPRRAARPPRPRRARTPTRSGAPRRSPHGCTAAPAACPRPRPCPHRCPRYPSSADEPLGSPWHAWGKRYNSAPYEGGKLGDIALAGNGVRRGTKDLDMRRKD